ncbi:hypothetical protein RRG08_019429 [Elysia crispata]|uniref:Uncharacterized protein n=1 Tax=Elysia crispata TaxID=231223 RepID=A0AAE1D936_9GAST|nr:hypothetical protein RRG08_019429 [Elysia crispata]
MEFSGKLMGSSLSHRPSLDSPETMWTSVNTVTVCGARPPHSPPSQRPFLASTRVVPPLTFSIAPRIWCDRLLLPVKDACVCRLPYKALFVETRFPQLQCFTAEDLTDLKHTIERY